MALRVRPANRDIPRAGDGSVPGCWLLVEWPPGEPEPTDYWLSTLSADTSIKELVRPARIRWRIEHDYRELKHGLWLPHSHPGCRQHAPDEHLLGSVAREGLVLATALFHQLGHPTADHPLP